MRCAVCRSFIIYLAIVLGFALVAAEPSTGTVENFYKGKINRFIVGYSPGGGFDTYTRLIARHFGKHVPENPARRQPAETAGRAVP